MRRTLTTVFLVQFILIGLSVAPAQSPVQPIGSGSAAERTGADPLTDREHDPTNTAKPVSFWMEKKLQYAQQILGGLAAGDLELVEKKAEQMRLLSNVEGWVRHNKPGYAAYFQVFEFSNAQLLKNARSDNLDGATIAFQQMTMSCVSCHKMLRDAN